MFDDVAVGGGRQESMQEKQLVRECERSLCQIGCGLLAVGSRTVMKSLYSLATSPRGIESVRRDNKKDQAINRGEVGAGKASARSTIALCTVIRVSGASKDSEAGSRWLLSGIAKSCVTIVSIDKASIEMATNMQETSRPML